MKTKVLSILAALFIGAAMHVNAETINYVWTKTVYADGRVSAPFGNTNCPFIFEGDRIYQHSKPQMVMGDGSDGYRLYQVKNGRSIYYYYRSGVMGLVQKYRASQPYWDFTTAIIVSSDKKTINVCTYDNSGNLQSTSVYKVPTAPGASDFIE